MLAREKSASLAEQFSVKLKFAIDTLNDWCSRIIKMKFFELDDIKKQKFFKENPLAYSKTKCSIYGFLLDMKWGNWFDFVVKCEHLFLRNIYSLDDLKKMDIESEEKYTEIVHRLLEFYALLEKALDDGDVADEVRNFLLEGLDHCYSTLLELKEEIQHVLLPKKRFATKKNLFCEKLFAFLYSTMVRFCETD